MNVTSKITVDLTRQNVGQRVNAVQGDGNTRLVEIILLAGGDPWTPPEGVEAAIAYMQPGGTKGLYNKLADGTAAISISGNVATVILAPQMLTASGTVQASLVFNDAQLNRLTTFPFAVSVTSNPAAGAQKTEDYLRLQWLEDKLDEYLRKAADSGAFDGADGKTPEYGVDYGTPEQIAGIAKQAAGILADDIQKISAGKVDKADGMGLSSNDYDNAAKAKVDAIPEDPKYTDTVYDDTEVKQGLSQIKNDLSDNAESDAETRRKLDYLWKLNQGISYQFETDDAEAYQKNVPSGAKVVSVNKIGGKTIVWNQMVMPKIKTETVNGITFDQNEDGTVIANGTATSNAMFTVIPGTSYPKGSIYLLKGAPSIDGCSLRMYGMGDDQVDSGNGAFYNPNSGTWKYCNCCVSAGTTVNKAVFRPQLFNITKMFGAGNEPATVEEFRAIFPDDYYPYNLGELVSADVESVKHNNVVMADIPANVRNLPGYGWSAGDVCNSIERTETGWQYVKRVGSREYQNGDTVTDGVTSYYALDNHIITDITDLMNDFPEHFEVEAGGTLSFENAAKLPVPSTEEYLISLVEVNQ